MKKQKIIIIGAGGHARVIAENLFSNGINQKYDLAGFVDPNKPKGETIIPGYEVIGSDDELPSLIKAHDLYGFVIGVGMIKGGDPLRRKIYEKALKTGLQSVSVVHASAIIAPDVNIGRGSVVMAGVVMNSGVIIGDNTIVNTRACLDHDCHIADHVHIAPGCVLSGAVSVGENSLMGTGSIAIQNVSIGKNTTIGGGGVVTEPIGSDITAVGVPVKAL